VTWRIGPLSSPWGDSPIRIQQVVAFGSILTEHDPIQDIDVGIELEPTEHSVWHHDDQLAALRALKGLSAALKLHVWDQGLSHLPARVIWKA